MCVCVCVCVCVRERARVCARVCVSVSEMQDSEVVLLMLDKHTAGTEFYRSLSVLSTQTLTVPHLLLKSTTSS